jgi:hypothetical protein
MASLPNDLEFSLKKAAPLGVRNFRTSLGPIGGMASSGFTGNDNPKFDIPTGRRGQYIDTTQSYLQFRVNAPVSAVGNPEPITLDGSAYCFFQRMTILSSGQTLEDITEYANFANSQLDMGVSPVVKQTAFNIMVGCNTDPLNTGNVVRSGVTIQPNTSRIFTLPLISGILGAQGSTKYLPVGAISSDLRLELVLHSLQNAVINADDTPGGWTISDMVLMLSYIELDSEVQRMIDASTGGEYNISSETWKTYTNSIAIGSPTDSVLIPARFSSIKGLLHTFRSIATQTNYLASSQNHRFNPFAAANGTGGNTNVQYTIGPTLYPNSAIRSSAEYFAETQRYFHNLANSNIMGSVNSTNYNVIANPSGAGVAITSAATSATPATIDAVTANIAAYFAATGSAVFGINLDQISNRSDVMNSGVNTLNSNIILNMTYATPPPTACRLETYAHIDMVISIRDGILTVRV